MPRDPKPPATLRYSAGWVAARRGWYRCLEAASPRAYCAWNRRFSDRFVVEKSTDLVIEGYPAAANSVARETFILTQPAIRVASHLHSLAHVTKALELGVPVLIVLRRPVDSIASIMARFPAQRFGPRPELGRYERLYTGLVKVADRVALSRFEDTVGHLATVTKLMNSQLGTHFSPFEDDDPSLRKQVHAVIDAWSETMFGERAAQATARPTAARDDALEAARARITAPGLAAAVARCEELHAVLAEMAAARMAAVDDC